ncbi:MAG: glycosyltransferase [Terracidiphilus sp.]|jgi:glycosyltransferase involved in cell wall biosynthesis
MRIAHVVDCMEVGGAETLVSQMCRLQREEGHDPSVYAVGSLGLLGERMLAEGFTVHAKLGRHLLDSMRRLHRIFKETHPDVVHLHNPTPTFYAAMAARLASVPSIVSTRHSLVGPPRRPVVELKYACAATCCDWIAGVCDATVASMKSLHSVPARKIVRIYNGALPIERAPKDRWPSKSGFTLVYVGRLAPVKNHRLLLNAFRAAHSSQPDLRLWMVGDGGERKTLESMASELGISAQVTFWGQQLDAAQFLSAADAFIMSSKSEGLPISLLQAFSLGLPAIVTDVGGMAEVVRLAKAGYTVPVSNSSAMAAAILRMAGSDVERQQFSANAAEAFRERFTLGRMVEAYMDLYRNSKRVLQGR